MKQFILSLVLIGATSFSGLAQEIKRSAPKQTSEQKAETEAARATKKLTLNDKQKAVYKQFVLQRIEANKPLRQKLKGTNDAAAKESLNKEIKANKDKFRANVSASLNPDQQVKWTEMNKRRDQKSIPKK